MRQVPVSGVRLTACLERNNDSSRHGPSGLMILVRTQAAQLAP